MLNRIKDFMLVKKESLPEESHKTIDMLDEKIITQAYGDGTGMANYCGDPAAHGFYCPECKTGFKTKAATSVHKRYKHGK